MPSARRTSLRVLATVVALGAGSTLALHGAAAADAASRARPVASAPIAKGLYQSSYSERNHALWATTAVGRPPVTTSSLVKLDPRTLEVEATYTPPVTDAATGAVEAVYGVAVDDEHNTVWTTNTRNDSVAVYSQKTGKHLATLPGVAHAREVVVDDLHNTAWASGFGDGSIIGFDTKTFKVKKRVTVPDSAPTGLAVNRLTGTVYAADLDNDRIIAVSPRAGSPRLIPTGDGPISVALSRSGLTAYTADQAGGTVSEVNLRTGKVTGSVPTGAGPLSVAADPRSGRVLVANRDAATVSVVDPRTDKVVRTVPTGPNPNHVEIADGFAYVTEKSAAGADGEDVIRRIPTRG
ncbi:YncE family protein [Streptomyces sp. SID5785]|uniref:YncE family protein n=1 Tax=Streptomyces sp. SID5785 TaxID=2690309 RepID=UPI0013619866|nr:YncE family protein [Streptomyces sp. SID5785]MZD07971.1 YncE family protein [Streptomyces sp. SID5785]MZD08592.1 YncE family protein [Streptomyces sp. SID5785]